MDTAPISTFPQWAATLLAALFTAVVSVFMTYRYLVKRKRLTFYVAKSEDLTALLRVHAGAISIKMLDREVRQLNRAKIVVKNTGNATITNVAFTIVIDGEHGFVTADARGDTVKLSNAIKMKWEAGLDPIGDVSLPFLNAKESFEIQMFFDGKPGRCIVHCRMEDVSIGYKAAGYDDVIGVAAELLDSVAPIGGSAMKVLVKAVTEAKTTR
jgi:uncharacterized repeat protein (TIGR01451 family)